MIKDFSSFLIGVGFVIFPCLLVMLLMSLAAAANAEKRAYQCMVNRTTIYEKKPKDLTEEDRSCIELFQRYENENNR